MEIRIYGDPAPQGSKTAYVRGGRAILVEANKRLPAWRETGVMTCFMRMKELQANVMLGPVSVSMTFYVERPKSVSRAFPNVAPDLDKYCRSVGDILEQGGVLSNDAQIVSLMANKVYADADNPPGCKIRVLHIAQ